MISYGADFWANVAMSIRRYEPQVGVIMDRPGAGGLGRQRNGRQSSNGNVVLDGGMPVVVGDPASVQKRLSVKKVQFSDGNIGDGCTMSRGDGGGAKVARQRHDRTLQAFYERTELFDDDEDDDSDWEPPLDDADSNKWFCTNCTLRNNRDVLHCNVGSIPYRLYGGMLLLHIISWNFIAEINQLMYGLMFCPLSYFHACFVKLLSEIAVKRISFVVIVENYCELGKTTGILFSSLTNIKNCRKKGLCLKM